MAGATAVPNLPFRNYRKEKENETKNTTKGHDRSNETGAKVAHRQLTIIGEKNVWDGKQTGRRQERRNLDQSGDSGPGWTAVSILPQLQQKM